LNLITAFDPLSYGVDGLRAALLAPEMAQVRFGVGMDLVVLAVVGVILLGLGAWRFSKIEI